VHKHFDLDKLAVTCGGSGDPALFVHGFGFTGFTWRHVCRSVGDSFAYYAIDLPGCGNSPAPDGFDYSLENISDVVADFIVRKDLKALLLVGWSLGSGIVLLSVLRHPELGSRIKSLCIIDGIAYPQKFPFFVGLLRVPMLGHAISEMVPAEVQASSVLKFCYFDKRLITKEQISEYARHLRKKGVRQALMKVARSIDTNRLSEYISQLNTIDLPSLLIWGREDRAVPVEIGYRLAKELKHSSLTVIERCGHMPHEERPDQVIAALRQFNHGQL
jgi:pimeloyl-ACP methyl ester carboxylesterase